MLGRVLDDMRTVCIDLTGDEEAQESTGHGAGTVRYGRMKRNNAHKDTAGAPDGSHCAGARHVNTVPDARAQRLASRHQAADDAQGAPAQHQVCKLIVTGLLCHCWWSDVPKSIRAEAPPEGPTRRTRDTRTYRPENARQTGCCDANSGHRRGNRQCRAIRGQDDVRGRDMGPMRACGSSAVRNQSGPQDFPGRVGKIRGPRTRCVVGPALVSPRRADDVAFAPGAR